MKFQVALFAVLAVAFVQATPVPEPAPEGMNMEWKAEYGMYPLNYYLQAPIMKDPIKYIAKMPEMTMPITLGSKINLYDPEYFYSIHGFYPEKK